MASPEGNPIHIAFPVQTGVEITPSGARPTFEVLGNCEPLKEQVGKIIEARGGRVGDTPMSKAARSVGMPGEKGWKAKWQPSGPDNPAFKQKPTQN